MKNGGHLGFFFKILKIFSIQLFDIWLYDIVAKYELSNSISEVIGAKIQFFLKEKSEKAP